MPENYLLSLLIFIPIVGSIAIFISPIGKSDWHRWVNAVVVGIQLVLAIALFVDFDPSDPGRYAVQLNWFDLSIGTIGQLSVEYYLEVDGFSILLVLLSGIVMMTGAIASWNINKQTRSYFALYALLSGTVMGAFISLDFFLFYLFFEFMLLPMYFLIGLWGGPRREYAAIKFFLYTLFGSVLILIVIIGLYTASFDPVKTAVSANLIEHADEYNDAIAQKVQAAVASGEIVGNDLVRTFNMKYMRDAANYSPDALLSPSNTSENSGWSFRAWAFFLMFVGFAIKLPAVPFHTWLPDAHVEAPTAISVVLAGILTKIGGYGILRAGIQIFPEQLITFSSWLVIVGVISIVYAGFNALAQRDLKKLIAYSSILHMGFVFVGMGSLTVEGFSGAFYMMLSHGIISAALFLITGVIYEQTGNREIANYSGLAKQTPYFTFFVTISFFASLGLPAFSGFVAEMLVFLGVFKGAQVQEYSFLWAFLSTAGLLLSAAYYLWTLQRMFFGPSYVKVSGFTGSLKDISLRYWILFVPLSALMLLFGIFPSLILNKIGTAVNELLMILQA
ncbi:MAG: NADH-quinone oxidoreductase subunit M [Cyclobacteriaceae bacterium]|nr:NADH-quinone oxidoreductase subunit M [Cyclobacteriaceae bacterium]MCH8515823.1 NADH-quinone oxidoreductase subunit M [Cyclobacteriaceae bacterium]